MKPDDDGTLWMYTGDEAVMDEEGYIRSKLQFDCLALDFPHSPAYQLSGASK